MNKNFANVTSDGSLNYANDWVEIKNGSVSFKVYNPNEKMYNESGFYKVNRSYAPHCEDGFTLSPTGKWKIEDNECRRIYNIVPEQFEETETTDMGEYDAAMEKHLLNERIARGYTTREPSEYVNSSVPRWKQDALDWIQHRDAVMVYALNAINNYYKNGVIPSMEDFVNGLPTITWSYVEQTEE